MTFGGSSTGISCDHKTISIEVFHTAPSNAFELMEISLRGNWHPSWIIRITWPGNGKHVEDVYALTFKVDTFINETVHLIFS